MKKENSTLKKKLKQYSALAGSMLAAGVAHGQIVYTDVDPDVTLNTGDGNNYALDMNNDGTQDYNFVTASAASFKIAGIVPYPYTTGNLNAIAGNTAVFNGNVLLYPYALALNDNID